MKQNIQNPVTGNGAGASSQSLVFIKLVAFSYKYDFPYGNSLLNYIAIKQRPGESFSKAKKRIRLGIYKEHTRWRISTLEYIDGVSINGKIYAHVELTSF